MLTKYLPSSPPSAILNPRTRRHAQRMAHATSTTHVTDDVHLHTYNYKSHNPELGAGSEYDYTTSSCLQPQRLHYCFPTYGPFLVFLHSISLPITPRKVHSPFFFIRLFYFPFCFLSRPAGSYIKLHLGSHTYHSSKLPPLSQSWLCKRQVSPRS